MEFGRTVDTSEGRSLANEYKLQFMEVSAKENLNIVDVFQMLGSGIKENLVKQELLDTEQTRN